MEFIYPNVIEAILAACNRYRRKESSIEDLIVAIEHGRSELTAIQENPLWEMCLWASDHLDSIRWTSNAEYGEVLEVILQIERTIQNWKERPSN